MRDDADNPVGVPSDFKIEPIISVHPSLPYVVPRFDIFLGLYRWMPKVLGSVSQKIELLIDSSFESGWQSRVISRGAGCELNVHVVLNFLPSGVFSHALNSCMVANFGERRPARSSARPSASAASISG